MGSTTATQLELPPSIEARRLVPEVMDDPSLDPALHEAALRGLGRINRLSRSAAAMWPTIQRAAACHPGRPLRVIDLACGGGDVLVNLAHRAQKCSIDLDLIGVDVSPVALGFAKQNAESAGVQIGWIEVDVFAQALPEGFDLAMNSLFMHHLTADQAVAVFRKMKAAANGIVMNDLRRGAVAHAATVAGTRLLSRSPVVHVDGPRSVRAAWTPAELLKLAELAGLHGATIRKRFPWRMILEWSQPAGHTDAEVDAA